MKGKTTAINKPIKDKIGKFFDMNFSDNDLEEYSIHYIKRMMMDYLNGVNVKGRIL